MAASTVVVTGAGGFLGWHLRCRLRAVSAHEVVPVYRADWCPERLAQVVASAGTVVHLAGVNRGADADVEQGNVQLAEDLVRALDEAGGRPRLVFANSVQAGADTPYGRGKAAAARLLSRWASQRGTPFADVVLPNVFGEHGRPFYNSFVATFCHQLVAGERPRVVDDRTLPMLPAQWAAQVLGEAIDGGVAGTVDAPAQRHGVGEVLARLQQIHARYRCGELPGSADPFDRALFNTYRSFLPPAQWELPLPVRTDPRGRLVEWVRSHGGSGQGFVSSTRPGQRRGDHFHLEKVERFVVLSGQGRILLRRLLTDQMVTVAVDGERPVAVDMPTLWAHALVNGGERDLLTMFWVDELYDPQRADTFPEPVDSQR
ncbi:MAG: NAD-dependent epimerase/dehydratase family protein [Actinomycetota bacterium]